ncbi:MAG: BON domain-containing protein, partial [Pseudomonadota bacterium]|nr:BON domain-containing protein [Pseudomonadota bacterium]
MAYSNYRNDWSRDRNERGRSAGQRDEARSSDDDDSRRARESMERDYYGDEMGRGGYRGRGEHDADESQERGSHQGQSYNRGYGQGDYDQDYGRSESGQGGRYTQGGRSNEFGHGRGREYSSGGRSGEGYRHHGNDSGGWEGREEEQWLSRGAHGHYDRDANYGGFSSSGTGDYAGYGGSGGSSRGGREYAGRYQGGDRNYQGQDSWRRAGMQYSQTGYGYPEQSRSGQSGYRAEQGGYGEAGSSRAGGGRAYGEYSGSPSGHFGEDYGQHRGRGPKGYKRSDDRIREEVCDCLTEDDRLDASNIDVAVKDGEVTLTGFVSARHDKRWAESLAERISGVKEVQNSLRVQDP